MILAQRAVAVGILMLGAGPAWAEESVPLRFATAASFASGRDSTARGGEKSPAAAFLLSTGSTILPIVAGSVLASHSGGTGQGASGMTIAGAGLLVGPSAGYFYGGCTKRGWVGIGIRAGITVLTAAAAGLAYQPSGEPGPELLVGGAGLALVAIEGLYECIAVGGAVHNRNEALRKQP